MTTIAYVRVSTEDQVEFSPDAQMKRCRGVARLRGLEPVTVLADEGWSGKNLDRPAVQELLRLVELGEVKHLLSGRVRCGPSTRGGPDNTLRRVRYYWGLLNLRNVGTLPLNGVEGPTQ